MSKTVLLVEDEQKIRRIVKENFIEAGYTVIEAENGRLAIDLFKEKTFDLIILDIMMPELDGWSVCRKIRKTSDVPVIILTARSDEDDKLMGFELGADEYVTKPFSPLVLVARADRLLKRVSGSTKKTNDVLVEGALEINKKAYIIKIDGNEIPFTPKEYDILLYLAENKGTVLTRDVLINTIWGYDYYGDDRIVDAHIKKIRKKMGLYSDYIHTVLRVGYKFEVK